MLKSSKGIKRATVVPHPTPIDLDRLEEDLGKLAFRELSDSAEESWGFTPPDDFGTWSILPRVGNVVVITLRHDRRVLNKSRLSREWHKACKEKAAKESRHLTKSEREDVREGVKKKLYPKTAPVENVHQAVYDLDRRLLVVLESSGTACDFMVDKLNRALEPQKQSIGFQSRNQSSVLEDTLTALVHTSGTSSELASKYDLEIGKNFRLEKDSCVATLKNHDCDCPEVREHLLRQKVIQQVELCWKDTVHFVLSAKRVLSQIDLKSYCKDDMKAAQESAQDQGEESLRTYQSATFMVWLSSFYELWDAVLALPEDHEEL